MFFLLKSNWLFQNLFGAPIIESKECQEIIQRVYDKFKIKNDEIIINKTEQQIKDYSTQCDNMFTLGFIVGDIAIYHLKSELLNHQDYKFDINWLN
ncbi:hypothetical protein ACTFIT_011980 [Dictyostelium discoideum]